MLPSLTVMARQQGRPPLDYLVEALTARDEVAPVQQSSPVAKLA